MNAIIMPILSAAGKMLLGILASALSENLVKNMIIIGLEKLSKKTDTDVDDRLLATLRSDWGINEVSKPNTVD